MSEYKENFEITRRKYLKQLLLDFQENQFYNYYKKYFDSTLSEIKIDNTLSFKNIKETFTKRYNKYCKIEDNVLISDKNTMQKSIEFLYIIFYIRNQGINIRPIEKALESEDYKLVFSAKINMYTESLKSFTEVETLRAVVNILNNNSLTLKSLENLFKEIEKYNKEHEDKNAQFKYNSTSECYFFLNIYDHLQEVINNESIDAVTLDFIQKNYEVKVSEKIVEQNVEVNKIVLKNIVFNNIKEKLNKVFSKKNYFKDDKNSAFMESYLKISKDNMFDKVKDPKFKKFVSKTLSNLDSLLKEEFLKHDLIAYDLQKASIDKNQNISLSEFDIKRINRKREIADSRIQQAQDDGDDEQLFSLIKQYKDNPDYNIEQFLQDSYPYYLFEGLLKGLRHYLYIKTLLSNKHDRKKRVEDRIKKAINKNDSTSKLTLQYLEFLLENSDYEELFIIVFISLSLNLKTDDAKKLISILGLSSEDHFNEKYNCLLKGICIDHYKSQNILYIEYLDN